MMTILAFNELIIKINPISDQCLGFITPRNIKDFKSLLESTKEELSLKCVNEINEL